MHGRLSLIAIFLLMSAATLAAEDQASEPPKVDSAKVLSRVLPEWPGEVDREAVVILRFDMLANGTISNVQLADGGFYEARFVDAAMTAVLQTRFEPERIDGKAVDTLGVTQLFKFKIGDMGPGITQEFRYEMSKVGKLLDKKDYAGANFHAEWMLSGVVKLTYEYAMLQAQLAETYASVGRTHDAIVKVRRATARSAPLPEYFQVQESVPPNKDSYYLLTKDLTVNLLELRMKLLAQQGFYLEALQTYYELAGLIELKPDDKRAILARELTAIIKGPTMLAGKVEIGDERTWRQHLSRRTLALDKVQGVIKSVNLRCSAKPLMDLEYKAGEVWKTRAEWGTCSAGIVAEPGTSFEILEFPDVPVPAPAR